MDEITRLQNIISASDNIVFFGGAGVSTESGIPDFRSAKGLYSERHHYPPETILSHSFFVSHPEEFFNFYRGRMIYKDAQPNAAHIKLAEMERAGKLKAVITQNIDGLHQAAGSKNVLELHGSVKRNYCESCGRFYGLDFIMQITGVPYCGCGGRVKPDVVLYEEELDQNTLAAAVGYISNADVLIVGGTSLAVYPAARLVNFFAGSSLVLINRAPTACDHIAKLVIRGSIGETLSKIII